MAGSHQIATPNKQPHPSCCEQHITCAKLLLSSRSRGSYRQMRRIIPHRPYVPRMATPPRSHSSSLGAAFIEYSICNLDIHTFQSHCRFASTRRRQLSYNLHREEIQVAHIVPQAELDWWLANDLSRYNNGRGNTLDDTVNAMLLPAGLHIAFDMSQFVFVPKPSSNGGEQRLVFHLLEPSPEYEHYHHNRELREPTVSAKVLFARRRRVLFLLLEAFLSCKKNPAWQSGLLSPTEFSSAATERPKTQTRCGRA